MQMAKMEITVEGKCLSLNYGTQRIWDLLPMFGERVLRIPEECVTLLSHQRAVLPMEDDWLKTEEWG